MEKYKIIGGDGREYGPAALDELKSWVSEGRVGPQTLVWSDDSSTWTLASKLPELDGQFGMLGTSSGPIVGRPVGFWPRVGAHFMDILVLWTAFSLLWPFVARSFDITQPEIPEMKTFEEILRFYGDNQAFFTRQLAVFSLLMMVYEVFFNGRFGATLGKMAIGARITRMDGSPIGYSTAFIRWVGSRISDMICYIGYIFIAFREDKRALHDLLAGTQVVYKR